MSTPPINMTIPLSNPLVEVDSSSVLLTSASTSFYAGEADLVFNYLKNMHAKCQIKNGPSPFC